MTCTDAQLLVSRLLDGEINDADSATLFTHLSGCADCRGFYRESLKIQSAMRTLASRSITIPAERTAPILSLHRPAWVSHVAVAAAAVALVVVGVLGTLAVTRFTPPAENGSATRVLWVLPEREITPSSIHHTWR